MNLIKILVNRPVTVLMFYLSLLIIGVLCASRLSVDLFPNTEPQKLNIFTRWHNSSANTIERYVTSKIEGVCNTVKGAKKVTSTSLLGRSWVSVEFDKKTNLDYALLELREKLNLLYDEFPPGVTFPQVRQVSFGKSVNEDSDKNVLTFSLT